ncbi:MAG: cytochrome C oxidase subunit II [Treponema sp.]|jgi:hypothetical protein|nr:cytochrome C oxidase subunit II [Treponema sp.]
MGTIELPKKNSANQSKKASHEDIPDLPNFDRRQMVAGILAQEAGRLVDHLGARLPKEAFADIGAKDSMKEKLHNCLEEIFQKVFCGYLETSEGKSLRDSIESDGARAFSSHSPGEVARLLVSGDGSQRFNAGEIEKSLVSEASAASDLDIIADSILRQKTAVGAFLGAGNACTVVKCVFRDNAPKPKTVTDVKLCVNIADSELIDPFFRYYATVRYLIKDIVCPHIIDAIDKEIESLYDQEDPRTVAYAVANDATFAEAFVGRVVERGAKTDSANFDVVNIRQDIKKNTGIENICSQGFGKAVNSLSAILDASKLSYQFIEYEQNGHKVTIREYEDTEDTSLPDERYQITLKFLDESQLIEDRKAYDAQIKGFENDVQHLWDLIEVIYQDSKSVFKVNDFEDLAKKNKNRIKHLIKDKAGDPQYGNVARDWDDISGARQGKESIRARLARMRERITNMSEFLYTVERRVMEERLSRLEKEYVRLDYMTNPSLLQSGLVIDVEITSIKRKKTTLDSVAAMLEEFLGSVSRGFQIAALATFDTAILPAKASRHR